MADDPSTNYGFALVSATGEPNWISASRELGTATARPVFELAVR